MRVLSLRRRFVVALAAALVVVAPAVDGPAWAAQGQKQVLVLYSSSRNAHIAMVGDRELPRLLANGLSEGLDYYSEFIDQARYGGRDYVESVSEFLRIKYDRRTLDLVIAMDSAALEFLEKTRRDLFPDTPVVFFSSSASLRRLPNSTGLNVRLDLTGTLDLVAALQPDVRNVFVVTGTDERYEIAARGEFQALASRFTFTYLSGLATNALERRLAALPPHSVVYYVHVARDGANENFNPLEYLRRVSLAANAPTYCWVDSAMDHGIVGGNLRSLSGQADAVAKLALRVLHGEAADSIAIATPALNVLQVDWRQLRRWGISESRVPPGTLVRFRDPSVWERYRVYILAMMALLLAQTVLIAALLLQRRRRRQAEQMIRSNEVELRTSYERIRDLGSRLLDAQDRERARIARELHDDISQQMALLEIDLELLSATANGCADGLSEALGRARGIGRSLHDLSHRLHPAKLRLIGLVPALEGLQRELSQSGVAIAFTHADVPPALPADLTLCLFRIVQEAVQNALKHGRARHVLVELRGQPGGLALTIADDGVGFEVEAQWGKGLGLISMGERLEAIGGRLDIRSNATGTRLSIAVPLAAAAEPRTVAV